MSLGKSVCPPLARLLVSVSILAASTPSVAAQQALDRDDEFDPLQMRRIPGTVMPSLRGSRDEILGQSVSDQRVQRQVRVRPAGADQAATEERDVSAPIPLSNFEQGKETRAPQVPVNNPQLPPQNRNLASQNDTVIGAIELPAPSEESLAIRQNERIGKDQTGPDPIEEADPFAASGFRMGTSIVNLRLEQSLGYSSNLDQDSDGNAGAFSQTDVEFSAVSDWSRHELRLDATGSFRKSFDSDIGNQPEASISSALRLDLIDGFSSTLGANYTYTTESLTSDNLTGNVNERPGIHTYGANIGVARSERKLNFSLRGSVERTQYEEASLFDGGALDQVDRNLNNYTVTGRVGYDTGAIASPFVEGSVGWRRFDEEVDRNGDQRNSTIYDLRAGYSFDNGEKLSGEIAIGYLREEFEEEGLETLEGYSLNGDIVWSPVRDTTVTLNAATSLNSSTTAGDNGSIGYTVGIDITRRATDRLELNANASVELDVDEQNDETDITWTAGIGAQYWVNRHTAISADLDFTRFEDGDGLDDYDDTTATMGVIFQK